MKIRILSDLHLEFTNYEPKTLPSCGEDLVVLSGDIGVGVRGVEWAMRAIQDRPVVYVLGNHEFYEHDWDVLIGDARACSTGSNVYILEDQSLDWNGIRVLGCSLWTDFRCMGAMVQGFAMAMAEREMMDFRLIRKKPHISRLSPRDTILRCERSYRWLEREIASADRPLLVVTHHAPTLRTAHPGFLLAPSNAAFSNDFDSLIKPPVVAWVHGHTHYSCEEEVNGIRVITNQRGYPGEGGAFSWDYLVEI